MTRRPESWRGTASVAAVLARLPAHITAIFCRSTSFITPFLASASRSRNCSSVNGDFLRGALHLHDPSGAGHDEIGIGVGFRVLGIVEVEHGRAVADAAGDRGDMVAQRLPLHHVARLHPGDAIVQRDPGAGDGRRARSAVGLDDIAIDGDLTLAQRGKIEHRPQAAPDQPLDLDGAPALLAGGSLAPRALRGGARQHAVFGRDPAARLSLEPRRQPVLERRRDQHMGIAEFHEAGTLGVFHHAAFERYGAQLVGLSAARPHAGLLLAVDIRASF